MRISDWSSDVCSSDLVMACGLDQGQAKPFTLGRTEQKAGAGVKLFKKLVADPFQPEQPLAEFGVPSQPVWQTVNAPSQRSEEHTSELQSLMRISYAVLCLKKTKTEVLYKSHTQTTHTDKKTKK